MVAGNSPIPHHEVCAAANGVLRAVWRGAGIMRVWCGNIWAYWKRLARVQRRDFIGPPEPAVFVVEFPWALRARLWLGARLKRLTIWVLGDLVPDPFDEDGPHYVESWVEVDGDEGS